MGDSVISCQRNVGAVLTCLFLGVILGTTVPTGGQQAVSLTVSAAISLKVALDKLGHIYEQSHPDTKVLFNYGSSGTLEHQIEQGAPVDIFFSAAEKQMDALESAGLLVAGTRRDLVGNQLVLVVPVSSSLLKDFSDLVRPEVRVVALGEPGTVPAGMYAHQTLERLGLLAAVENRAVYARDVRAVLTYVETGNADAGIVYQSDARTTMKVRVVATAPWATHDPIAYPAAVIRTTKNFTAARAFLDFLEGPDALAVFEKCGFTSFEKQAGKK
jgi:molybdate transport system substrate-binding protein